MAAVTSGMTRRELFRKFGKARIGAAMLGIGGSAGLLKSKRADAAGPGIPWTCMSQSQRNAWLAETAKVHVNKYETYDGQCKGFARVMVYFIKDRELYSILSEYVDHQRIWNSSRFE
ncbi:MAG: hypothetical protein HY221_01315 [Candidatus Sungbacteria bacterium]|uniref:Uncharacterized protein n=1 Tax=Candidatus Sungiibacteriota bacterium TaxID=2750080 RepID=A0A932VRR4_9BACT|nr:hypothetical protein [Candidatus Sungbacteria bacterium]